MATLKKMTAAAGYHECSRCHERISVGSFYVRDGSRFTHSAACAAPAPAVSIEDAEPAPVRPVAPRAHGYRAFGNLLVDESFAAWEREYENEGR